MVGRGSKQRFPFSFLEGLLQGEQQSGAEGQPSLQVASHSRGFGLKMLLGSQGMSICEESASEEEGCVPWML